MHVPFHLVPIARKIVTLQQVLLEAKYEIPQVWSIGTCGKDIQVSTLRRNCQGDRNLGIMGCPNLTPSSIAFRSPPLIVSF